MLLASPVVGVNGSGMHTNVSSAKWHELILGSEGGRKLSKDGWLSSIGF